MEWTEEKIEKINYDLFVKYTKSCNEWDEYLETMGIQKVEQPPSVCLVFIVLSVESAYIDPEYLFVSNPGHFLSEDEGLTFLKIPNETAEKILILGL